LLISYFAGFLTGSIGVASPSESESPAQTSLIFFLSFFDGSVAFVDCSSSSSFSNTSSTTVLVGLKTSTANSTLPFSASSASQSNTGRSKVTAYGSIEIIFYDSSCFLVSVAAIGTDELLEDAKI